MLSAKGITSTCICVDMVGPQPQQDIRVRSAAASRRMRAVSVKPLKGGERTTGITFPSTFKVMRYQSEYNSCIPVHKSMDSRKCGNT